MPNIKSKRIHQVALPLLLVLLSMFLADCSEPNQKAPADTAVHPELWNNTRLLASDLFHGTAVNGKGTSACTICHGSDLQGNGDIPGCYTCHFDAAGSKEPEGAGWVHGQAEHSALETYISVCNECHRIERRFGTGPEACHDCHGAGINHVLEEAWLSVRSEQFHGRADLQDCSNCHDLNQKCFECHFGPDGGKAPIGSNWIHENIHDDDQMYQRHENYSDSAAICNQCHALSQAYGNGPPATCHNCHGVVSNHVLGEAWLSVQSEQFHGRADLQDCSNCHYLNQKCFECHFGPDGGKAPIGSNWIHENIHDDDQMYQQHENYSASAAICNQCHALSRSFGNGPADCHDCHGESTNHVLGQPWLDKKSQLFHGAGSLDDCSDCHDLSLKCSECHFGPDGSKAPPGTGWNHGNNEDHRRYSIHATVCNQCHALNRTYGNGPASCHDCHDDD